MVSQGGRVPAIWRLEVANGLRSAVNRQRISPAYRDAVISRLAMLDVSPDPETDRQAWGATATLSASLGLTPYDAAYLELAARERLPLVTLDRALTAAARALGVEVFA